MRLFLRLAIGISIVFTVMACGGAEANGDAEPSAPDAGETVSSGQDDPTATPTETPDSGIVNATMTGEMTRLGFTGEPEVIDMTTEYQIRSIITYWDTNDDDTHEITLFFSPARLNGFIGDTNYRSNGLDLRVVISTGETVTFTLPEDNDLLDPDYSLINADGSTRFEPPSQEAVTGTVTLTLNEDGTLSGDINVTVPLVDDENQEPVGEITLDIPFEDIPLDNLEDYQDAIEGLQREADLLQAMIDGVDLEVSGVLELSIGADEALYHRPGRSLFLLRASIPDVVLMEIGIDDDVSPGTYTPEGLCADFSWDDTCFTLVAFDEDGNYTEYVENITGNLVIESVIPLQGTVDLTVEDMAGNTITITGDLNDVPFPLEDNR